MSIVSSPAAAEAGPLVPAKPGGQEAQAFQDATAKTGGSQTNLAETPMYSSPKIYLDPRLHEVFYEIRNPQTGTSEYTIPSQSSAKAYETTQQQSTVTQQGAATTGGETGHQDGTGTGTSTSTTGQDSGQQAQIAAAATPAVPATPAPELSSGAGASAPESQAGSSSTFA
jgi:hypothetical protein